ncbi:MAG: hypothetical protein ACRYFX_23720 [Janthinobacterium lividum]
MKLKKLKSIGHNAAHSYFSTLGHIGQEYTCTVLHRLALTNELSHLELDVLNAKVHPIQNLAVEESLSDFREQFFNILQRENIPVEAVESYRLSVELLGNRMDVVDIRCQPQLTDMNGKIHVCAEIRQKYPEPVR